MKRSLIVLFFAISQMICAVSFAQTTIPSSGKCGNNVSYTFNSSTGALTISGSGSMYNSAEARFPWTGNYSVRSVVINEGVTSVSSEAFYYCYNIETVTLPSTITSIGYAAFMGCNIKKINTKTAVTGNQEEPYAFDDGTKYSCFVIASNEQVASAYRQAGFYNVVVETNMFTIYLTVTDEGTALNPLEYEWTTVSVYNSQGGFLGHAQQYYPYDEGKASLIAIFSPDDASSLNGEELVFHLNVQTPYNETSSIEEDGEYIIHPQCVLLNNAVTKVKYTPGGVAGSETRPITLNYVALQSITPPSAINVKVGETVCVEDLFKYTPSNASVPLYMFGYEGGADYDDEYVKSERRWDYSQNEKLYVTGISPTANAPEEHTLYVYCNYGYFEMLNIPINVTLDPNTCLYYVTVMADHEPLNHQWWISEMDYITVTPYVNGVAVGEPQSVLSHESYDATGYSDKSYYYIVSIPANTYAGKTVEFHVTTAYDEEYIRYNEISDNSLPMSGEFIIRDVSWSTTQSYTGSTMPVTKGKAWGAVSNPVILNFVRPTSITTNPSSIDLRVGKTYNLNNLKYTFNPATSSAAVNFSPEWTVGNYVEYMKVEKTNNGTILTALKEPPYAPITVDGFAEDYAAVSVPVNITSVVSVTGITIPDANKNQVVWLGDVWQDAYLPLDGLYKITPTDATNQSVTWTSSDASVAVVDGHSNEFGEWYAVGKKAGKTTLTVKTVDGGKTASLNLEVRAHVTGVELKKASVTVKRGSNTNLSNYIKSVLPTDAYDKSVTWAVNDTSTVVTIDQSFGTWQMKANRAGTTTLVVTSVDNPRVRAYLTVTVESSVTDITIPDANKNQVVWLGDVWQEAYLPLDDLYEITPKDATNQEVTWTSSDESIVSVYTGGNEFGEWYAVGGKVGKAVLTVTTVDGGKTASLNVEVRAHVSGIELKSESVKVNSGSTTNLSNYIKSVLPTDAYDKSVTWAVTDTSTVVTVSQSFGTWQMKANRAGFTYLKVTSVDNPDVSAFLTVTVESKVTGITVAEPNQILYIGESANLKYTIQPSDATNKGVTWTSSDASVVRIESNPNITTAVAQKVGTAVLTATTLDGGKTATINVEVRAHVESITLTTQSITVNRGTTTDLSKYIQSVLPANAYDKSVKWTSSNSAVVSINGSMAVANAIGSCRLTATSVDNPRATATLDITVEAAASGIYATNPVQTVWIGEDVDLSTYFVPADATSRIKSWTSSDASVVAISGGATTAYRAVAQKAGTAVLTVTTDNGQKATIQVTVHAHVTGIELTTQSVTVNRGSTTGLAQYIKAILPTDAYDKSVTWAVNDTSTVVTVSKSNDGTWQMKANQVGFTTLRVTSVDNPQASAFLSVQVDSKVTGITVEEPNQILYIGEYANLNYTILPSDATNKNVTWTSSDNSVVKVEPTPTGYSAVAQKVGKAILTVTTADGGKTATINIDARAHVESITLTTQSITVNRGNTVNLAQYIESVLPANAYDKSVTWASGNPDIVSITGSTAVAKAIGSCRVTATSVDNPRASASLEIVVEAAADGINVNNPVQTVWIGEEIDLSYYFVPADATSNIKSWTSSDPSVVAISGNGTTTAYRAVAQKSGKAVLTVTTDNGQTATIQVTVRAHVEAIRLTVRSVRVNSGTTTNLDQFIDVILPEDAYDKSVTWAVTDTSTVVSVSRLNSGAWQMTANKVGTTTLQVTSVDNPQVSAILMVMVESVSKEIEAEEPEQTIWIGEEVNLNIVFDRPDATTAIASWTSSNPDVVSVTRTEDGTYRAVGVSSGEATLTVTTDNGLTTTIDVTVHAHVEDMTTVVQEITILKGETISLSGYPSFQPSDAYNKDVVWTSGDESVVSVSGNGTHWTAAGVNSGNTTLTVTSVDNPDIFIIIEVHVSVASEGIIVNNPKQKVPVGLEVDLSYRVIPEDASQIVTWSSSDDEIVSILEYDDGSIHAYCNKKGTAVLTVTTEDDHSATIEVEVYSVITGIEQGNFTFIGLVVGESSSLSEYIANPYISIIPEDADDKRLAWSDTEDESVAKVTYVDGEYYVTGIAKGHTLLKMYAVGNPSVSVNVYIDVVDAVESFKVNNPEQTVMVGDYIDLSYTIMPESASDRYVIWTVNSSVPDVCMFSYVYPEGDVCWPTKSGSFYVVGTPDGIHYDSIHVTAIRPELEEIRVEYNGDNIMKGDTLIAKLTAIPDNAAIDATKLTYKIPEAEGGWKFVDVTMDVVRDEEIHLIIATHTWGFYTIELNYPGMEGSYDATTGAGRKKIQDIHFNVGQHVELEKGWNWVTLASTNAYQGNLDVVGACFDNKLIDGRTQKDLIYYDSSYGYVGTLFSLANDCYKISVSEDVDYKRTNVTYDALHGYVVHLKKGWNWIEYPYDVDYTIEELRAASALSGASYADRIISKDGGFTEWSGYTWSGDLKMLHEDEGYMYYSSTDHDLIWPAVTKLDQKLGKASGASSRRTIVGRDKVWNYNHRLFADNMTIIADVKDLTFPDDCSIGAFVDGECRGEGHYVEGHFFITVHGEMDDVISFVVHDSATDTYYTVPGTLSFDLMAGSLQHPIPFKVGEKTTDIELIRAPEDADTDVYDLVGRKVVSPATGIYIKNGKKTYMK